MQVNTAVTGNKTLINIGIGEYYASNEGAVIQTILGSCVAVCLFDPKSRIGGMNHIFLPGEPRISRYDASARYGINAMELLINEIMKLGGKREKLIAKTFGGANVLQTISKEYSMGSKIVAFVLEFLQNEKIRIISQDFGGNEARKIFFHTETGEVFLKRISSKRYIDKKEQKRLAYIKNQINRAGDVTLFDPE